MNPLRRGINILVGLGLGYVTYRLWAFAWKAITTLLGQITALHLFLAILAIPLGLITGLIALFLLVVGFFGD